MRISSGLSKDDWKTIGNGSYNRIELYSLSWADEYDVDLDVNICVGSSFAGPIAVTIDEAKIGRRHKSSLKRSIKIFSCSGEFLGAVDLSTVNMKLINMGWTFDEELIVLLADGTLLSHDVYGQVISNHSFGSEVKDIGVVDAKIFHSQLQGYATGVAVLTDRFSYYIMSNAAIGQTRKYGQVPNHNAPPTSWAALHSSSGFHMNLIVARDADLYILKPDGVSSESIQGIDSYKVHAWLSISVSPSHSRVAMFSDTGLLWIGTCDLRQPLSVIDTGFRAIPSALAWHGEVAVISAWAGFAMLYEADCAKPAGKYEYDGIACIVTEIDSVRLITKYTHELIYRVPHCVADIFEDRTPANCLYNSSQEYYKGSAQSHKYLEDIHSDLEQAVTQCVDAAGQLYFGNNQQTLLRAAAFGAGFLTGSVDREFNTGGEKFADMCRLLRVLNAVRHNTIGLPLTYTQIQTLTIPTLIDRLIYRRLWPLAVQISNHLGLGSAEGESRVLAHWACWKVDQRSSSMSDESIATAIRDKLQNAIGISYADIAQKALQCGRNELAIQLINFEPRISEQIPLLLSLSKESMALQKAVQSGDPNLIYDVVLQLNLSKERQPFLRLLTQYSQAQNGYIKYLKQRSQDDLMQLYIQNDSHLEVGLCRLREAKDANDLTSSSVTSVTQILNAAKTCFEKGRNEFFAMLTDEQIKLLKHQYEIEKDLRLESGSFVGTSLHTTLSKLIAFGKTEKVELLRKQFKVQEKTFWWIKVIALGKKDDWHELEKFSRTKKSPIGYVPFVIVCMNHDKRSEAEKYISKIPPEDRVKPYIKMGALEKAAEQAFLNKNINELQMVQMKCGLTNKQLSERIRTMLSQLR